MKTTQQALTRCQECGYDVPDVTHSKKYDIDVCYECERELVENDEWVAKQKEMHR